MTDQQKFDPVSIYLAGPCYDHTGDFHSSEAKEWREVLVADPPSGVVFVSPAHAFFGVNRITAPAVDVIERTLIYACDGVLALVPSDVPVFGTIRDIEYAKLRGKPVAVATSSKSLMIYDLIVREDLSQAFVALLEEIMKGRNVPQFPFAFLQINPFGGSTEPENDDD